MEATGAVAAYAEAARKSVVAFDNVVPRELFPNCRII